METGRRAMLFSEVNDRIFELLNSAEPDLPGEFLCECGKECGQRVELVPAAFASLRDAGRAIRSADCSRGLFGRRRRDGVSAGVPVLS